MTQNKPSFLAGINPTVKRIFLGIIVLGFGYLAYSQGWIPGLSSQKSKTVEKGVISDDNINVVAKAEKLPVLDYNELEYAEDLDERPEIRVMNWIWFANAPIFSANGGPVTMKGSLMDNYGLNVRMITNNMVGDMKREQLAFIQALSGGDSNPGVGVHYVTIMGDGAIAYISAMNKQIIEAFGPEYALKIVGIAGFSMGEDCVFGPQKWIDNPQSARGAIIVAVIGDGDWALMVRWAADNGIPVNPDPDTYDPNAINFIPAADDDFLKAADAVIAGTTYKLKVKDENGRLTGETVVKKADGSATWFPGDRRLVENTNLVKVVSTSQYPNQMACVIVGCNKWMQDNPQSVTKMLSATLIASNQIKQYPEWKEFAYNLAPKVFCADADECSETAADWRKYSVPNGGKMQNSNGDYISVGGTQFANLADNKKYFGLKGGTNYYKTVYDYFSGVITDLNPYGIMDDVGELTTYEDAVDLTYLNKVDVNAGSTTKVDYSKNKGEEFANRSFKIEFVTGSAEITAAGEKELEQLFQSITIAENARVNIVGHTDNVGDAAANDELSLRRAKAVKAWLMERSGGNFPSERFSVDGEGEDSPVATNATAEGRQQNRRVEISLLQ